MNMHADITRTPDGSIEVVNVRAWRRDAYLYIGRPMSGFIGSAFANPFKLRRGASHDERMECLAGYREWLIGRDDLMSLVPNLRGHRLGCWCAPLPCHGHVLKELAETVSP
jgi:hypothetical protein